MIHELAHMFRAKYPISIIVEVTEENFADIVEWTGGHLVDDGIDKWIAHLPGTDDDAEVGNFVVKNGDGFTVYTAQDWHGDADHEGFKGSFEPIHFDAPDEER